MNPIICCLLDRANIDSKSKVVEQFFQTKTLLERQESPYLYLMSQNLDLKGTFNLNKGSYEHFVIIK